VRRRGINTGDRSEASRASNRALDSSGGPRFVTDTVFAAQFIKLTEQIFDQQERGLPVTAFASLESENALPRRRQKLASSRRALADATNGAEPEGTAEPEGAAVGGERAAQERAQQPGGAPDAGAGAAPAPTPPQPAHTADAGDAEAAHGAATVDAAAAAADAAAATAAAAAAAAATAAKGKRDAWWIKTGKPLVDRGDMMLAGRRGEWRLSRQTTPEEAQKVYVALAASLKDSMVLHKDDTHRRSRVLSTSKQLVEAIERAVTQRDAQAAAGGISRDGGAAPERASGGGQLREPASGSPGRAAGVAGGDEEEGDPAGASDVAGAGAAGAGPARGPGARGGSGDAAPGRRAEASGGACGAPTLAGRSQRKRSTPVSLMAFDEDDEDDAAELAAERAAAAAQAPLSLPESGAMSGKRRRVAPSWLDE
jgi:hypothetical protein